MNKLLALSLSVLLTGCASQKFDCPHSGGVYCKSLAEVDKQSNASDKPKKTKVKKLEPKKAPDSPFRTKEEVLSLWVAPYQTEDGTYHEEKIMHFVVKPAEWNNTALEITEDENAN